MIPSSMICSYLKGKKDFTSTQKSVLHHPDDSLRNVMVFSALANRNSVAGTAFVEDGQGPLEEACLRLLKEVCDQFQLPIIGETMNSLP